MSTSTLEGIARIETIGAIVRGEYGQLARIVGVHEHARASARHISVPLDVVVATERVGPGYGHTSSWASKLTLAQDGDIGAHPHTRECECGEPYDESRGGYWYDVRESWSV